MKLFDINICSTTYAREQILHDTTSILVIPTHVALVLFTI